MRKQIENIILACVIILGVWSIVSVVSATLNSPDYSNIYIKQIAAFIIGLLLMFILKMFSFKILEELSPVFYFLSVLMLVTVLVSGTEIHGGRRWFDLGFFYFQPAEFAKFSVILFLGYILQKYNSILYSAIAVFAAGFLVLIQPDAGSSVPFAIIFCAMLGISRINTRWMGYIIPAVLIAAVTLFAELYLNVNASTLINWKFILIPVAFSLLLFLFFREAKQVKKGLKWSGFALSLLVLWFSMGAGLGATTMLKGYQKKRIISFLIPELDPLGTGYNTRQSLLATGSGRLIGKGLFNGTQTQLGFLPVKHTDFIFASIAEELGFAGSVIMLFIITLLLWQIIRVIERSEDYGGRLIATGIFALILTHVVMNLGVTLGLLPVIGIQLPFVSYGGTGMVIFMAMIGVILNINKRTEIIGVKGR